MVGTETFWSGIRRYYARFQNSAATSDDLRHAMEEACVAAGDKCPADGRDLSWLFRELLNRGGVLQVQGSWQYDAGARQVRVTLDQVQPGDVDTMPIEVAISTTRSGQTNGASVQIARLTERHHVFTFASDTEPSSVQLDPNAWVMMRAELVKK